MSRPRIPRIIAALVGGLLLSVLCLAPRVTAGLADEDPYGIGQFEGWTIDTIIVEPRNIYDLGDERYQSFLFGLANKFHMVTRERIVRQELLLETGGMFSRELAEETARNLRTRFPMNEAWVEARAVGENRVAVKIVTIDQWSLVGGIRSIDRDGQETNYQIGFEERNFLGGAQFVSFDFFYRDNDPNYIEAIYRESRLFGRPLSFGLAFRDNPYNTLRRISLARPYYSLAQSFRAELTVTGREKRHRRFDSDGNLTAEWFTGGETIDVESGIRFGTPHEKVELYGAYRYLWQEVRDGVKVFDPELAGRLPTVDSIYHEIVVGGQWSTQNFIVEKRIRGFDYSEDFVLGASVDLSLGRAFRPEFDDHYYDVISGRLEWSEKFGSTLLGFGYDRTHWFRGSTDLRRLSSFSITGYNNRLPYVTFAFRSLFMADRGGLDQRLILGGKSGLRGYPREAMAGNRLHVINLETRFFPGLELLSVQIGGALFTDLGRTFKEDESFTLADYRISAGVGLRLSLEKLRKGEIIRIDLAAIRNGDLDLSFSTGQYF